MKNRNRRTYLTVITILLITAGLSLPVFLGLTTDSPHTGSLSLAAMPLKTSPVFTGEIFIIPSLGATFLTSAASGRFYHKYGRNFSFWKIHKRHLSGNNPNKSGITPGKHTYARIPLVIRKHLNTSDNPADEEIPSPFIG